MVAHLRIRALRKQREKGKEERGREEEENPMRKHYCLSDACSLLTSTPQIQIKEGENSKPGFTEKREEQPRISDLPFPSVPPKSKVSVFTSSRDTPTHSVS